MTERVGELQPWMDWREREREISWTSMIVYILKLKERPLVDSGLIVSIRKPLSI